jgi:threonine/homoserine/homoserine lactone efflux protein
MSLETYLAFVVICAVAVVIPGPTNTLILANGIRHGVRPALLNVAGTLVGLLAMLTVVALGLTSLIEAAGHWFEWIKLAGAAYLVWIGWKMIRSSGGEAAGETPRRRSYFLQGMLVSLGNPKQLLFFGALLPQFVDPAGAHVQQILILGVTALGFALVSDGTYALAAASIGRRLSAARARWIARIGGGFLIGGGIWLALSKSR